MRPSLATVASEKTERTYTTKHGTTATIPDHGRLCRADRARGKHGGFKAGQ